LGNRSFVGHQLEDFTPEEDLLYTSIAVVRIFDRLGDRKNLARNRLRYLVNDMGWEKFQNLVLKERAIVRATQSVVTRLKVDTTPDKITRPLKISDEIGGSVPDGYARWLKTNTIKQKQSDYRSVFITLEAGDITSNQLNAIANIIREFSSEGKARSGFVQNVAIRYVHEDDLVNLYSKLLETGLAKSGGLTMTTPVGCSGTTSCNLALTNSHRLAKEIQRKFLELKLELRLVDVLILVPNMGLQQLVFLVVVAVLEKTCIQIIKCPLVVVLMVILCWVKHVLEYLLKE